MRWLEFDRRDVAGEFCPLHNVTDLGIDRDRFVKKFRFTRIKAWRILMEMDMTIDGARQAMIITMYIAAPVLIVGMVSGLIIGLLQALTQIQDQTISFVPKFVAMIVALGFSLPWVLGVLMDYARALFGEPPAGAGGLGG